MKSCYEIIVRPHITERTVGLSYGNPRSSETENIRKYTFVVTGDSNKIEVKRAIEEMYNAGKKKGEGITVTAVHVINMKGKTRRVGLRKGKKSDWKKAIVTLAAGQMLDDYGV